MLNYQTGLHDKFTLAPGSPGFVVLMATCRSGYCSTISNEKRQRVFRYPPPPPPHHFQ